MKTYYSKIFERTINSSNIIEIVSWWNKGRLLINVIYLVYSVLHFLFIFIFLENGFVYFLLPVIPIFWVIINIVYTFGLTFELIALKIFKSKINFNVISPSIKIIEFIIIGFSILFLSIWNILYLAHII